MAGEQEAKQIDDAVVKRKRGRSSGPSFPRDSLKKALRLAESIEKNNAGQPFDRIDLAKSIDASPNSSGFRVMIISSGRYDLTSGGYMADKIELTSLGSSIVAPTINDNPKLSLRKALTTPEVFKNVFERFNKKNIPRDDVFKSTLKKDFGIPSEDVDACYRIIMQNIDELGLIQDVKGNQFINLDKLGEVKEGLVSKEVSGSLQVGEEEIGAEAITPTKEKAIPKVFISHSKNENIIEQLKTILEFGDFQSTIAEEVETTSIPIPDKIFGLMRECNCAIINVSADEEMKQEDGNYRINENVLIEIGGAFVHYDKRVLLLVDKRIELPSNLQGLYRFEYEGNELSFPVAMKLQKALTEFKKSL